MANAEQLSILKQGVVIWNAWRSQNKSIDIDFSDDDLSEMNLLGVNFRGAHLTGSKVSGSNLRGADLSYADLNETDFHGSDLKQVDLFKAEIHDANFSEADLRGADLGTAQLERVNLQATSLGNANFTRTHFYDTFLALTDFSKAEIGFTIFENVDMSRIVGLDRVTYSAPSTIGTNTLALSRGKIPDVFLRGCGLSDWEIEAAKLHNPELSNGERNQVLYKIYDLQASQAIQISPLFISYSHGDHEFVDKIDKCLTEKGIRFWRDIHDLKAGRIERQIDEAISQDRTVLLVLSEYSLKSDWVEHEVRKAREIAKHAGRDTLCPVALDDSWKKSPWPTRVMEQIMEYNILDFSEWKDEHRFDSMFRKLIDGLELFYKA